MAASPKDSQISLRLPDELKQTVASYAAATGRSSSHVAMEALREYLDWRVPQVEDLRHAIAAADAGEFASEAEVRKVVGRYAKPAAAKGGIKPRVRQRK